MGAYSKLHDQTYHAITKKFPHLALRENVRPEWLLSSNLTKLELDIFIEELGIAIEIQGAQHYQFTPHFHKTYQDFKNQCNRDREKRALCDGHGIKLIEISMGLDLKLFIEDLEKQLTTHEPVKIKKYSLQRSKSWRRWWRNKKLRLAGLLPPGGLKSPGKQPGSRKQRKYARKLLICEKIDDRTFKVWGGKDEHIVKDWQCDCWQAVTNKKICSHVIKIGMELTL